MQLQQAIEQMIERQLRARGIADEAVLEAMRRVPRHHFVPDQPLSQAYADQPLPTEHGQTISQPYIVARMTELLQVRPGHKVLEVGTGSGYQTAVLLELGAEVVTIERFESLAERARQTLKAIVPDKPVTVVVGDGTLGWPDQAPYDRIIATAGAPEVPQPYRDQLADGGRMVLPVGFREGQTLMLIERDGQRWREVPDTPCRFVPLVGEAGWDRE